MRRHEYGDPTFAKIDRCLRAVWRADRALDSYRLADDRSGFGAIVHCARRRDPRPLERGALLCLSSPAAHSRAHACRPLPAPSVGDAVALYGFQLSSVRSRAAGQRHGAGHALAYVQRFRAPLPAGLESGLERAGSLWGGTLAGCRDLATFHRVRTASRRASRSARRELRFRVSVHGRSGRNGGGASGSRS